MYPIRRVQTFFEPLTAQMCCSRARWQLRQPVWIQNPAKRSTPAPPSAEARCHTSFLFHGGRLARDDRALQQIQVACRSGSELQRRECCTQHLCCVKIQSSVAAEGNAMYNIYAAVLCSQAWQLRRKGRRKRRATTSTQRRSGAHHCTAVQHLCSAQFRDLWHSR